MASETKPRTHYTLHIGVMDLALLILRDWKRMSVSCLVAAFIGVFVAFSIPRIYRSGVMLAPEESQNGLGGNVSSLASMVGLDMKLGSNDAIYPEIYPEVIHSTEFLTGLFDAPVVTQDESVKADFRTYLTKHQKMVWWDVPIDWVRHLMRSGKGDVKRKAGEAVDPAHLTFDEDAVARTIDSSIKCLVDKKTEVISIDVVAQDPLVAKTMVDTVTSRLQQYVTDYRTRKAKADLAYIEKIYDEAKRQYDAARAQYAAASNSRQDVVMETARIQVKNLENEMQLKYSIYTQVAEQRQLAEANVQKMTPAFTVIKNSTVPVKHANSPKILILLLFVLLGFVGRTCALMLKHRKEFLVEERVVE